jgi:hypothetical protein
MHLSVLRVEYYFVFFDHIDRHGNSVVAIVSESTDVAYISGGSHTRVLAGTRSIA